METLARCFVSFVILILLGGQSTAEAQTTTGDIIPDFSRRKLSGPRLGVSWIPAGSALYTTLRDNNVDGLLSQFGWHFEHQVVPRRSGPSFVIQWVPMVAGVEHGKVILHGTFAMGVRMPNGIEFGLGPNVMIAPVDHHASLIMGLGRTFDYQGVSIPVNLIFASNPDGERVSLIFGYAINRD